MFPKVLKDNSTADVKPGQRAAAASDCNTAQLLYDVNSGGIESLTVGADGNPSERPARFVPRSLSNRPKKSEKKSSNFRRRDAFSLAEATELAGAVSCCE